MPVPFVWVFITDGSIHHTPLNSIRGVSCLMFRILCYFA
jgi:hypothetical protein